MDLRGYGDSGRPAADDAALRVQQARDGARCAGGDAARSGIERFQVLAHDRGARVAHRLAADHPRAVERLLLLDIAPTLAMYEHTTEAFARAYWHWFFLIQPPPLPEALIDVRPRALRAQRDGHAARGPGAPSRPRRWPSTSAAPRCPARAEAICEDYRAAAAHRPGARPRRRRRRPSRSRSRCACCGASTAWSARASTCWRCGASAPTTSPAAPCPAATTSPKRRRARCSPKRWPSSPLNHRSNAMSKQRIAVIAGDGIGKETMPEGMRVLDAAARKFGIDLQFDHFDFSSWDYYEKHGKMLPDDWKDQIGGHDAIYFGAVGWPEKIAGPCLAVGLAAAVPPRVRPVRQPAAGAADARHRRAGGAPRRQPRASRARSTCTSCARTPKASTPASAGACTKAPRARSSCRKP